MMSIDINVTEYPADWISCRWTAKLKPNVVDYKQADLEYKELQDAIKDNIQLHCIVFEKWYYI